MFVHCSWLVQVRTKQQKNIVLKRESGMVSSFKTEFLGQSILSSSKQIWGEKTNLKPISDSSVLFSPSSSSATLSIALISWVAQLQSSLRDRTLNLPEENHPFSSAQAGCSQEVHVKVPDQVQEEQGKLSALCKMNAIQLSSLAWEKK